MTCPNGCSGHGTCETVAEIAQDFGDRRNGPGHRYQDLSSNCPASSNWPRTCALSSATKMTVSAKNDNTQGYSGHIYNEWDNDKIQICKCDLGYKGSDCSQREAPKGDDPLTVVKAESMKQLIQITGATGGEFFLKFHDPYGGIWRTDTIRPVGGLGDGSDVADTNVALYVHNALQNLPNNVMDQVKVTAINSGITNPICHRFFDGVQHFAKVDDRRDGSTHNAKYVPNHCLQGKDEVTAAVDAIDLKIEFGRGAGQSGVQYLLDIDVDHHGPGSFPVSSGVIGTNVAVTVAEINYNDNLGNLSELSVCSDRGLDNGDGECDCFDGYQGLACEEQVALV